MVSVKELELLELCIIIQRFDSDEATSALDNKTEEIVMEAVNKLRQDVTIVMIAHRLTTLKNCDLIFRMENGKLVNQGTFEELINNRNN